jgi:hypothetical protein
MFLRCTSIVDQYLHSNHVFHVEKNLLSELMRQLAWHPFIPIQRGAARLHSSKLESRVANRPFDGTATPAQTYPLGGASEFKTRFSSKTPLLNDKRT